MECCVIGVVSKSRDLSIFVDRFCAAITSAQRTAERADGAPFPDKSVRKLVSSEFDWPPTWPCWLRSVASVHVPPNVPRSTIPVFFSQMKESVTSGYGQKELEAEPG